MLIVLKLTSAVSDTIWCWVLGLLLYIGTKGPLLGQVGLVTPLVLAAPKVPIMRVLRVSPVSLLVFDAAALMISFERFGVSGPAVLMRIWFR